MDKVNVNLALGGAMLASLVDSRIETPSCFVSFPSSSRWNPRKSGELAKSGMAVGVVRGVNSREPSLLTYFLIGG